MSTRLEAFSSFYPQFAALVSPYDSMGLLSVLEPSAAFPLMERFFSHLDPNNLLMAPRSITWDMVYDTCARMSVNGLIPPLEMIDDAHRAPILRAIQYLRVIVGPFDECRE